MFWAFFFLTIIISLPFILIYFAIRNFGIANTMNGLSKMQDDLKESQRVFKIIKHIAECSQVALQDLKFVQKNVAKLQTAMINEVLKRAAIEGKQVDLTEDEEQIATIFKEQRLTKLSADFNKIAEKCADYANIDIKKSDFSKIEKYFRMTDSEIIESFVSKEDQEWCKDLAFVKQYIENL